MKKNLIIAAILGMFLFACNIQSEKKENQQNYLDSQLSIKIEQENIQKFFDEHNLKLKIIQTKWVDNYRIFLHDFTATENQIRQIIKILNIDSVSQKDFDEIHSGKFSNADFKIYSSVGKNYLKDPSVLFYKGEINNKNVQQKLKVSKVYLYFNRKTGKACFQIYYDWG